MRNALMISGILFIMLNLCGQKAESRVMSPSDTAHYYMKHSYDVQNYKLDIDLYSCYATPYPKSFAAKEVITFKVDSALNSIRLNAVSTSLQIDSVRLSAVSFSHSNDTLTVNLNRTYLPGELVSIRICYRHNNVSDNAFYTGSGYAFFDFPPEGARKCFPCWDKPSDKATWDLTAKVPLNVRLGSNGRLADSTVTADTIRYHWISRDPLSTYLMTLTSKVNFLINITYWHKLSNPGDSIPARFYYKSPENPGLIESILTPMTNFYSEKFGEYPFEKIGFATLSSIFPWGGMENQTMINLQPNGWQEGLISHEFSHQWFGDLITCGTWADVWLNESFGTYCESLWLEYTTGYTAYKDHLNGQGNYYISHNPGFALYTPDWALHTPPSGFLYNTAVIYDKGACVLHQLRYVIGDSLFFAVLHDYATDTNLVFGNAVTEDFISKVNAVCGQDYSWFFDEWIYHPNHPVYQNFYGIEDLGNSTWKVVLSIEQTQTNTSFFQMPLQIQVNFNNGTDTLITVFNDVNPQLFDFVFHLQPTDVIFDPLRNILLKQAETLVGVKDASPGKGYILYQNDPNPFRKYTRIRYTVPVRSHVKISVIDSFGKQLTVPVDKVLAPGRYELQFSGEQYSPGIYYCKMEAGSFSDSKKMVITK